MHEAHLMRDLMREIARVADEQGARRVVALRVWLGALSHMTPAHFRAHFLDASAGTIAEGARVEATQSGDETHPDAQRVRLETIDVA